MSEASPTKERFTFYLYERRRRKYINVDNHRAIFVSSRHEATKFHTGIAANKLKPCRGIIMSARRAKTSD